MRRTARILALAAAHFIVGLTAFGVSFSRSMHRFDHGGQPGRIDTIIDGAVNILWFPYLTVAQAMGHHGGRSAQWLLLAANSLLWGLVLYVFLAAFWRRLTR